MSRIAYVNGRYLPQAEATVHIEDRGFQFADGVYEVWAVLDGKLVEWDGHVERLARSLAELRITHPIGERALKLVAREMIRRNRVRDGLVYIQITRGQAPRDHAFPAADTPATVVLTARSLNLAALMARGEKGVAVTSLPEDRWGRCDIKTVGLLSNAMAKQQAKEKGAFEAWYVDDLGLVTEGSSTNAWIVDAEGVLRTRDTQANILRGITRRSVAEVAKELGVKFAERAFSLDEAKGAREAFITSASAFVTPVTAIDGTKVGDGKPGELTRRLRDLYLTRAKAAAV